MNVHILRDQISFLLESTIKSFVVQIITDASKYNVTRVDVNQVRVFFHGVLSLS